MSSFVVSSHKTSDNDSAVHNMADTTKLYRFVGEQIKRRRKELGMTQADLADAIGQLRTSVANIEAGRQKTPLHVLYDISAALDISLKMLLPEDAEVIGAVTADAIDLMARHLPQSAKNLRLDLKELKRT